MLKMDMRPGESIMVGETIIKLIKKSGQVAVLGIEAARSIPIKRVGNDGKEDDRPCDDQRT